MTLKTSKDQGDSLYKQGKYFDAALEYSKVLSGSSADQTDAYLSHSNRCACYQQLGEFTKALADAEACIRLKPDWAKGYIRKASALVRLNRKQDAILAYSTALHHDSNNTEAQTQLAKLRAETQTNSSTRNTPTGATSTFNWQDEWNKQSTNVLLFFQKIYFESSSYWTSLSPNTQRNLKLGLIGIIVYFVFFHQSLSGSYYPSYGYSGYDNGGGGMSWSMWLLIMYGAYRVPPMFPELLGDFSRPFFGLNWTTFMWLLNMVTSNRRGGGRGMGLSNMFGGFGPRRRF